MTDLNVGNMAIASGVLETIIAIAAKDVKGVASIGPFNSGGLRSMLGSRPSTQGIEVEATDDGALDIAIRITVYYGYVLPEVAAELRSVVADAVSGQLGASVNSIDVYIDGIQFAG